MPTAQYFIDVAATTNASNLGSATASEHFRLALKNSVVITTPLTDKARKTFERYVDMHCVYSPAKTGGTDHDELTAMREACRQVYDKCFGISTIPIETLVFGAAGREVSLYDDNPAVKFYFGCKDAKDVERVVVSGLKKLAFRLNAQAAKAEKRLRKSGSVPTARKRYEKVVEIMKDYGNLVGSSGRYHDKLVEAQVVLFEDSFYNLEEKDYIRIFSETGAHVAYGYGMLPLDLAYPELPSNELYYIIDGPDVGWVSMNYKGGYSNGYSHKRSAWSTLLLKPVLHGKDFDLVVEIVSRAGPMAVFKIVKTSNARDTIVRPVALPEVYDYVRIVDIAKSINMRTGRVNSEYTYMSIFANEYYSLLDYLLSLAPISVTLQNAMTYIRRKANGTSLVNKDWEPKWQVHPKDWYNLAMVTVLHASMLTGKSDDWMKKIGKSKSFIKMWTDWFVNKAEEIMGSWWCVPLWSFYGLFYTENMLEKLVLSVDSTRIVYDKVVPKGKSTFWGTPAEEAAYLFAPILPKEETLSTCWICAELKGRLGAQLVRCEHKTVDIEMALSTEYLNEMQVKLNDTDNLPAGLAAVMARASKRLPKAGFKHTVKMHYIRGGPGTGKSYIIRKLATMSDLILAPFSKLRKDYLGVDQDGGEKVDLVFKTQHRALETTGARRIFVDEFTSFPYEYLMVSAYLNGSEEVIIVGDTSQTGVREGSNEGLYIGNHVDIDKLGRHTLMRNFRNPAWVVAYLNKVHGYEMESMSASSGKLYVLHKSDLPKLKRSLNMSFSHASCVLHELGDTTVRACQGADEDDGVLYVGATDGELPKDPALNIVSLSRHKGDLYVVVDDSEVSNAFVGQLSIGSHEDWIKEIPKYKSEDFTNDDVQNTPAVAQWLWELEADERALDLATKDAADSVNQLAALEASLKCNDVDMRYLDYDPDEDAELQGLIARLDRVQTDSSDDPGESTTTSDTSWFLTVADAGRSETTESQGSDTECEKVCVTPLMFGTIPCSGSRTVKTFGTAVDYVVGETKSFSNPDYNEATSVYTPVVRRGTYTLAGYEEPELKQPKKVAPEGSVNLMHTLIPMTGQCDIQTSANIVASAVIESNFRTGVVSGDVYTKTSMRGHPTDMTSKYRSMTTGNGLHFGKKKPAQTAGVLNGRYLGRKKTYPYGPDAEALANAIADNAYDMCMRTDAKPNEVEMQAILTEFDQSAAMKNYEAQYRGIDNTEVRTVRFTLKDMYKPKGVGEPNLFKVGQGVSAWDKDLMVLFGPSIRIVNKWFKDGLKSNVMFDNRMTEAEARDCMQKMFSEVPAVAKLAKGDWETMDACQQQFTQAIERRFLYRGGFSEQFIAHYFYFRNGYIIAADGFYGKGGSEKTSGEPGTLLFNTILCKAIKLWIVRGEGPFALVVKGDDSMLKQMNMVIDMERLEEIQKYADLKVTFEIDNTSEFCGNALTSEGYVVPFIVRKWKKVASHRFRDYQHFVEYQASLRDWDDQLAKSDTPVDIMYAVNAELGLCTKDEVEACHLAIRSISHLSEEQFMEQFPERLEHMTWMTSDGVVVSDA